MQVDYSPEINTLQDMRAHADKMFYFDTNFKFEGHVRQHAKKVLGEDWKGEARIIYINLSNVTYAILILLYY